MPESQAGRVAEALQYGRRALDVTRKRSERGWEAHILHLVGEAYARRDPVERDLARLSYRQALTLAEGLGMRPLAARCHLSLARFLLSVGDADAAGIHAALAATMFRELDMPSSLLGYLDEMTENFDGPIEAIARS